MWGNKERYIKKKGWSLLQGYNYTVDDYLLSGYHVALELLMAFVPSALACSFTTGSEGQDSKWSTCYVPVIIWHEGPTRMHVI